MAITRRTRTIELPDLWRRFFDVEEQWLRVEEYRDGDTLVVKAEIPGIDPDKDVEITVSDGMLQIRAEREEKTETTEKAGYRSEFRYGSFARSVALPRGVKAEDVAASYKDGVLEVRVPIPAAPAPGVKTISVSRG
jgi:HSP20 family protein